MTVKTPTLRRKRFQFSLRTLTLCVLAYGGLWLITLKWGANQLVRERTLRFISDRDNYEWIRDGYISFNRRKTGNHTVTVSCPAPLVLTCGSSFFEGDTYFWFFGYRAIIVEHHQDPSQESAFMYNQSPPPWIPAE